MLQFFSRPDWYAAMCGDLRCKVVQRRVQGPSFMKGLRAAFVTDIHVTARATEGDIAALVKRVSDIRPDILLLGGDYADRAEHTLRLLPAFRALHPRLGAYAVLGNNDREAFDDPEALRRAMDASNIRLLVSESVEIALPGGRLIVAGVDEYRLGAPDARGLYPEAADPDCYRLLLSHYPVLPEALPDLMLCGHTHGGQFNLLGVTPYTIGFERNPFKRQPVRYIAGMHRREAASILVSKGIGASRLPMRLCVRPEIEQLDFC